MITRIFLPLKQKYESKTRLYLLRFDFIATDFSQTETNRPFWIISDESILREEQKKVRLNNVGVAFFDCAKMRNERIRIFRRPLSGTIVPAVRAPPIRIPYAQKVYRLLRYQGTKNLI